MDGDTRRRLIGWNFTPNAASIPASIAISYTTAAVASIGSGVHTYRGLAGLEAISPDESGLPSELRQLFADTGRSAKGIQFPGDLGKFLCKIEQYEYALVLRGNKGAGKSRLLYQLMNLLPPRATAFATSL